MPPLSLADLEPGSRALIEKLDQDGPLGRRLLDLGFAPETEVEMIRRAPFGDPSEYGLRGYRICLRRSEACRILVRPLPGSGEASPRSRGAG